LGWDENGSPTALADRAGVLPGGACNPQEAFVGIQPQKAVERIKAEFRLQCGSRASQNETFQ